MTKQVVHVEPLQTVENSMALLCEKRFRHLPELTQGNLVGVLFVSDLVGRWLPINAIRFPSWKATLVSNA